MKIVDLSLPIDEKAFEVHHVAIDRITHRAGIEKFNRVIMGKTLAGRLRYLLGQRILKKEQVPDEEFLSLEVVHAPVHVGTHLDYSFHYGSRSAGRPSKTAEEIPLEWCFADGVRLDLTHKKFPESIVAADIDACCKKARHELKAGEIVLLHTGSDRLFGTPEYFSDYPGVDVSAIDYLLDRGIRIFGIDTMGIDRPYKLMLKEFISEGKTAALYPAHFHGRKREFIHIERLANLGALPDAGFKVSCLPVKIKRTGAAWARVVAFMEEA